MADDAPWYEAALLVGVTNALNVVADSPLASLEPAHPSAEAEAVFAEIRAFYACAAVPAVFRRVAADPGYLADLWGPRGARSPTTGSRGATRRRWRSPCRSRRARRSGPRFTWARCGA